MQPVTEMKYTEECSVVKVSPVMITTQSLHYTTFSLLLLVCLQLCFFIQRVYYGLIVDGRCILSVDQQGTYTVLNDVEGLGSTIYQTILIFLFAFCYRCTDNGASKSQTRLYRERKAYSNLQYWYWSFSRL